MAEAALGQMEPGLGLQGAVGAGASRRSPQASLQQARVRWGASGAGDNANATRGGGEAQQASTDVEEGPLGEPSGDDSIGALRARMEAEQRRMERAMAEAMLADEAMLDPLHDDPGHQAEIDALDGELLSSDGWQSDELAALEAQMAE
jgi:hypothetical protein